LVARGGIEPPTQGFSKTTLQQWPIFGGCTATASTRNNIPTITSRQV
jgi:hypothetical protein